MRRRSDEPERVQSASARVEPAPEQSADAACPRALEQARLDVERLAEELARVRRAPLANLADYLAYRVLGLMRRAEPLLPERVAARFAKSREKRDPLALRMARTPEASLPRYRRNLAAREAERAREKDDLQRRALALKDGRGISLFTLLLDADPDMTRLADLMGDFDAQSHAGPSELLIAARPDAEARLRDLLDARGSEARRVALVACEADMGPGAAAGACLAAARGDFVARVGADDRLDPDVLLHVSERLAAEPHPRIVYTDEDMVRADGTRLGPNFKPDWNRELFYGTDYVSGLCVIETALARQAGGFRDGFAGAEGYDLLLRCLDAVHDSEIGHVPRVLYSRRRRRRPVPAGDGGTRALRDHLREVSGAEIEVSPGPLPHTHVACWPVPGTPLVSIVIPTRDRLDLLRKAVTSILRRTSYGNYEIVIVDNESRAPETLAWLEDIAVEPRVRVMHREGPFNFSALNNAAVAEAQGEVVALLNNDVEVIDAGWLTEMVGLALRPDIGCVGAKLLYPDGRVQHGGVLVGVGGISAHSHRFYPSDHPGYQGRLVLRQEYLALTGACLVVRKAIYHRVGGLNAETLGVGFNDIDFCLKVGRAGYRNLWTPLARLVHHESASRKPDNTAEKKRRVRAEEAYMRAVWADALAHDPSYNPNLTSHHEDFDEALT